MTKKKHKQKEAYYFSHDSNARHDPKILALRSVYDYLGYGWYFAIIEILREQQDYRYKLSSPFSWNALALELNVSIEKIKVFIDDCVDKFELFTRDNDFLWSESLIRRMQEKEERTRIARKASLASWEKRKKNQKDKGDANAKQMQSESNADAKHDQSIKGNKRKGNENKLEIEGPRKQFFNRVFMTDKEYADLIREFGPEKALDYMQRLDLHIGSKGVNYDSHHDTVKLWILKDQAEKKDLKEDWKAYGGLNPAKIQ